MKIQAHITHHIIHLCNNRYITALRKQTAATGRRRSHGDRGAPTAATGRRGSHGDRRGTTNSGHWEETLTRGQGGTNSGHREETLTRGQEGHQQRPPGGDAHTGTGGAPPTVATGRRRSHGDRRGTNSGNSHRFVTIILPCLAPSSEKHG